MKKTFVLYLILGVTIIALGALSGCSKPLTPEEEAKEVIRTYMDNLYSIDDFTKYQDRNIEMNKIIEIENKLKPYLTENGYNKQRVNREIVTLLWSARYRQANVSLENLELTLEDKKEDDIWFRYTAKIKLTYMNKVEEDFEMKGQLQTIKTQDKWKINIDRPLNYPFKTYKQYETMNLQETVNSSDNGVYSELKSYVNAMFFAVSNTTNEKLNLRFPNSKRFTLILYKDDKEVWQYGDEVSSFGQNPSVKVLDKGENLVFCVDYPFNIESGEYDYEFNITAEQLEDLPPLKGKIIIEK